MLNATRDKVTAFLSIQPRPCADPSFRGQHAPAERVALAVSLCGARYWSCSGSASRPTGAYELVEALKLRDSRPAGPTTVHRAFEFLMSQGLVSKIESRNALRPLRASGANGMDASPPLMLEDLRDEWTLAGRRHQSAKVEEASSSRANRRVRDED